MLGHGCRAKSGVVSIMMIATQSKSILRFDTSLICKHSVVSAGRFVGQVHRGPRVVWDLSRTLVHDAYVLQQISRKKSLSKPSPEGKETAKKELVLNTSPCCYSCHDFPFLPYWILQEDLAAPWSLEGKIGLDVCERSSHSFYSSFWG